MPLVKIGQRHRADFETDLERYGFSSFTSVIDAQPNLGEGEQPPLEQWAQCVSCTFVDFLRGMESSTGGRGLREIRTFFAELPSAVRAVAQGDASIALGLAQTLGAAKVLQLVDAGATPLPELPAVFVVSGGREHAGLDARPGDRMLFEPNGRGAGWLYEQLDRAARQGIRSVAIGYHRHASAMDHWTDFVEHEGFAEDWPSLPARAGSMGFDYFGMFMAYPPCASLRWKENEHLEQIRARMDLHFRRLEKSASLMCPENVSGYALTSDVNEALARSNVLQRRHALRFDRLLFLF